MTLEQAIGLTPRTLARVGTDASDLRSAFARFPSGLAAICASVDGEFVGIVASSFSVGVSFDPPLVMFSVQNASTTWPRLRGAASIGISILGQDQARVASQLASRSADRFADLDLDVTESGAVLIHKSTMWLECSIISETPAGDHHIVVLEVTRLSIEHEISPLVYHGQKFHSLRAAG